MSITPGHSKIYKQIVTLLERVRLSRQDIILSCIRSAGLLENEGDAHAIGSAHNRLRSNVGAVLNEMEARDLIATDTGGLYYLVSAKPVIIRIEKCENEIIKSLTASPLTKRELRDKLKNVFGTDKTATTRDDETLFSFMGQVLKKLQTLGIISLSGDVYSLTKSASAKADDINAMLSLKSDFLSKIHMRGGEFFENYFLALLSKYSQKHGRKILECYVTGGAADGGIDGVMRTEDSLGFLETTMVQTKNRNEIVSETDVRGFYGAVCAKRGSRGIFATTSDFHSGAQSFLDSLDDCVGINGERLFKMALECQYGIKKSAGKLVVDTKII
ncbi:MAG: restriction endonuclease [Clostridia bacterium]|nr:restriction endonuclease [Clostridia bacterium]